MTFVRNLKLKLCVGAAIAALLANGPAEAFSFSGLTKHTAITNKNGFIVNTSTYTNQSGKTVMGISSISRAPSQPAGTLAPKGLIINRNAWGTITSAKTIGGYAPGTSTAPSNPLTFGHNNAGPSVPGFGGSGLSQNTTNSHQATQGHNITNTPPSGQAHQGKNCTPWLHQNGFC